MKKKKRHRLGPSFGRGETRSTLDGQRDCVPVPDRNQSGTNFRRNDAGVTPRSRSSRFCGCFFGIYTSDNRAMHCPHVKQRESLSSRASMSRDCDLPMILLGQISAQIPQSEQLSREMTMCLPMLPSGGDRDWRKCSGRALERIVPSGLERKASCVPLDSGSSDL